MLDLKLCKEYSIHHFLSALPLIKRFTVSANFNLFIFLVPFWDKIVLNTVRMCECIRVCQKDFPTGKLEANRDSL